MSNINGRAFNLSVSCSFLNGPFILTTGCFYETIRTRFRLMIWRVGPKNLVDTAISINLRQAKGVLWASG
jgi:hypothetical protein